MPNKEAMKPKGEPPKKAYAARRVRAAVIKGMSKILMRQRKTTFERSRFVRGKTLRVSTIFEETRVVETCSPIIIIKNNTTAKKAETTPTKANSLGGSAVSIVVVEANSIMNPKIPMKTLVMILLIRVFVLALLASWLMLVLPLWGRVEPERREKID